MQHVAILAAAIAAVCSLPNPSLNIGGHSYGKFLDKLPSKHGPHGLDINLDKDGIDVKSSRTVVVEEENKEDSQDKQEYSHDVECGNNSSHVKGTTESEKSHQEKKKHVETKERTLSLSRNKGLTATNTKTTVDEKHIADHEHGKSTYSETNKGNGTYHKEDCETEYEKDKEYHGKETKKQSSQLNFGLGGFTKSTHDSSQEEHSVKALETGSFKKKEEDCTNKNGDSQKSIREEKGNFTNIQSSDTYRERQRHTEQKQNEPEKKEDEECGEAKGDGTYHKEDCESNYEKNKEYHAKEIKQKSSQLNMEPGGCTNSTHESSQEEHSVKASETGSFKNREEECSNKNGESQKSIREDISNYTKTESLKTNRERQSHTVQTYNESEDNKYDECEEGNENQNSRESEENKYENDDDNIESENPVITEDDEDGCEFPDPCSIDRCSTTSAPMMKKKCRSRRSKPHRRFGRLRG